MKNLPKKRALISVFDKTNIVALAKFLVDCGYELIASSGTAQHLYDNGVIVTQVGDVTGFAEMMDGRVKTLHPHIHGSILARRDNVDDIKQLQQRQLIPIDIVVVNLYPFEKILSLHPHDHQLLVENIDIGGPAMLRAAAKNHTWVSAVVDPKDYDYLRQVVTLANTFDNDNAVKSIEIASQDTKKKQSILLRTYFAQKAFRHVSAYDDAIAKYLQTQLTPYADICTPISHTKHDEGDCANALANLVPVQSLRYGENSHQQAVLYCFGEDTKYQGWAGMKLHQGKQLSYNNIVDADIAWRCVCELSDTLVTCSQNIVNAQSQNKTDLQMTAPAVCVIVKHANPCGAAYASDIHTAYQRAYASDPQAAFGGIIAMNTHCDGVLAQRIIDTQFVEVIIAHHFDEDALALFTKRPNVRLLHLPSAKLRGQYKSVSGGVLWQSSDNLGWDESTLRLQVKGKTSPPMQDIAFAWILVKHLKSNAIALVKNSQAIGLGIGQTSRIKSLEHAFLQAIDVIGSAHNCVLASEAFFPFSDSIEAAARHKCAWIIQPGGSQNDAQVIDAARQHGIGMYFTGTRHFYH